ncbi:SDR family NAD(P)-dependent oxidoreductase [Flavitalea flava]
MKRLAGKVALITGGSRGIGAAIAKRLAKEGAVIALTFVSAPEKAKAVVTAIEKEGGRALAISADNTDPDAVVKAVRQTVKTFGHIDILVNNAGIYITTPLEELTPEEFDRAIAVNVKAVFFASAEASRHMTPGGRVITIGSNMADRVVGPGGTLYALSKSALSGFTRGLARDLGPKGITVNLVQPGPIDTDMNPANTPLADFLKGFMIIPEYGSGEDIAGMVAFLASEEGKYMTGSTVTLDGGFNA